MNKALFLFFAVLQFVISFCALITLSIFFVYYHEQGVDTKSFDLLTICVTACGCFLPSFLFLFIAIGVFGDKSRNGFAKTVRYVLSNMRVPGFWSVSIRKKNNPCTEKMKDSCSVFTFFSILILCTVVYFGLVGLLVWDSNTAKENQTVQLLDGMIPYKPKFVNESELYVRPHIDRGNAWVVSDTELVKGNRIVDHGESILLTPDYPDLSFAFTVSPGSWFYLCIVPGSNMLVYYKRNETVINNRESMNSFRLDFNETSFTSYLINISSGSSNIRLSFDLIIETMVFKGNSLKLVEPFEDNLRVLPNETLVIKRDSPSSGYNEYVNLTIRPRKGLVEALYDYQWEWYCILLYLCGTVFSCIEMVSVMIITNRTGHAFTDSPESARKDKSRTEGYLLSFIILFGILAFFIEGTISTTNEINDAIKHNTVVDMHSASISAGQQIIVPLNDTKDLGLQFTPGYLNQAVRVSCVKDLPESPSLRSVDCTPGPFDTQYSWSAGYHLVENYSISWDVEASVPFDVELTRPDDYRTVFYESNVSSSKHVITVNNTGKFMFCVKYSSFLKEPSHVTFKSLVLNVPWYNVTKDTVWSTIDKVDNMKLEPEVKYVVYEPVKDNSTEVSFGSLIYLFDDEIQSCVLAYNVAFGLMIGFIVIICVWFCLITADCAQFEPPCCYLCADMNATDFEVDENSPLLADGEGSVQRKY